MRDGIFWSFVASMLGAWSCSPVARPVAGRAGPTKSSPEACVMEAALREAEAPPLERPVVSPLHGFATLRHAREEAPPRLHICPLKGGVWFCDGAEIQVVRGGAIEHDTSLEAGLPMPGTGRVDRFRW